MRERRWMRLVPVLVLALAVGTGCSKKSHVYEPPTGRPLGPAEGTGYSTTPGDGFDSSELDGSEVNMVPDVNMLEITEGGGLAPNGRAPSGPKVQIPELATVYFDFDASTVRADQEYVLQRNAEYLLKNPGIRVEVQGHCDERGTEEYNLALGDRRALTVRAYLTAAGVEPARVFTISYGEAAPAVEGQSEDAYAQNRRAEFRVIQEEPRP